jgi:hypothetical protein
MTIFRSGTLEKVYALGTENYTKSVLLYGACSSVPTGTRRGMVDRGFFTSTVIVKEGHGSAAEGKARCTSLVVHHVRRVDPSHSIP